MRIRGVRSSEKTNKSVNQTILEILGKGTRIFGEIQHQLKQEGFSYSRKGLSLRLESLVKSGFVIRHPIQQGHFSYSLSRKGQKDVRFQASAFSQNLEGFLRDHFGQLDDGEPFTRDVFINRMVKRIGIFVLFSLFQSLRLASQKPRSEKNATMLEWLDNSFSFWPVVGYFIDSKDRFLKFRSHDEAMEDQWSSVKKQSEVFRLEEIFKNKFPREYEFCQSAVNSLPYTVASELIAKKHMEYVEKYLRDIHRKHGEYRDTKPNDCPECRQARLKDPSLRRNLAGLQKNIYHK